VKTLELTTLLILLAISDSEAIGPSESSMNPKPMESKASKEVRYSPESWSYAGKLNPGSSSQVFAPIVNGLETNGAPNVAALLVASSEGPIVTNCTATLIGCNTLLTAAHCFCGETVGSVCDPRPMAANTGVFFQHAGLYGIASVDVYPGYNPAVGGDIAVVHLENGVPIGPARINQTSRPPYGTEGLIVGFGRTRGDRVKSTGVKRAGIVEISPCIAAPDSNHLCWNFLNPIGPTGEDSTTCKGDSGGPLFMNHATEGALLTGVTTATIGANPVLCMPDALFWDADVFVYRSWILGRGGADVQRETCSAAQPGEPKAPIHGANGTIGETDSGWVYDLQVPVGVEFLFVSTNGEDSLDVDLLVRRGQLPTTDVYDCKSDLWGPYEACVIENPAAGNWKLALDRYSGSGRYQLNSTLFMNAGSDDATGCDAGPDALYLESGRFRIDACWKTSNGDAGTAKVAHQDGIGATMWFFQPNNPELFVKIKNACVDPFNRFWVFAAGLTNVEVELKVTDTERGFSKTYKNPQGQAMATVVDTNSFATCP